jgi:hypothetical protein
MKALNQLPKFDPLSCIRTTIAAKKRAFAAMRFLNLPALTLTAIDN